MKLDVDYDTGKSTGWYYYTSKGAKAKIALNGYGEFFNEDSPLIVLHAFSNRKAVKSID